MLLLLACSDGDADTLGAASRPPPAAVDSVPMGARFVAEVWGTDITPEQARHFELVAGELAEQGARLESDRAERVRTLARIIGQDPTSGTTAQDAARAIADQDATILKGRAEGVCKLFDTLSEAQREARQVAGRVTPVLAEALPRSGTNTFDFAAPLLRREARDVQAGSRHIDGAWAPVDAAVKLAEPALATIATSKVGWCRDYLQTLAPVHEAWNAWHRQSVMAFSQWIVTLPVAERSAFLDADGLEMALRWSVGTVEKGGAAE